MSTTLDSDGVKRLVRNKSEAKTVIIALSNVGFGFGLTEKDIAQKTELKIEKVREILSSLQYLGAVELKYTQIGTSGPYDYFFRLNSNILVVV